MERGEQPLSESHGQRSIAVPSVTCLSVQSRQNCNRLRPVIGEMQCPEPSRPTVVLNFIRAGSVKVRAYSSSPGTITRSIACFKTRGSLRSSVMLVIMGSQATLRDCSKVAKCVMRSDAAANKMQAERPSTQNNRSHSIASDGDLPHPKATLKKSRASTSRVREHRKTCVHS